MAKAITLKTGVRKTSVRRGQIKKAVQTVSGKIKYSKSEVPTIKIIKISKVTSTKKTDKNHPSTPNTSKIRSTPASSKRITTKTLSAGKIGSQKNKITPITKKVSSIKKKSSTKSKPK